MFLEFSLLYQNTRGRVREIAWKLRVLAEDQYLILSMPLQLTVNFSSREFDCLFFLVCIFTYMRTHTHAHIQLSSKMFLKTQIPGEVKLKEKERKKFILAFLIVPAFLPIWI